MGSILSLFNNSENGDFALVRGGILPSSADFNRASVGTYFDSGGVMRTAGADEARVTHLPGSGGLRGLLIEEGRENISLYSEDITTGWINIGCAFTADSMAAPDGSISMDELISDGSAGGHAIIQTYAVTGGQPYTASVFARSGVSDFLQIFGDSTAFGTNKYATFDLAAGVVGGTSNASATITDLGGGLYRCTATITADVSAASGIGFGLVSSASGGYVESFSSPASVHIWGMQVEEGNFATSYIKTTSAAAARAPDNATLDLAGAGWFNPSEGTIFVHWKRHDDATGFHHILDLNDGTTAETMRMLQTTALGGVSMDIKDDDVVVFNKVATIGGGANVEGKLALAYKENNCAASLNGSEMATDTSCTIPAVTQLNIGRKIHDAYINGIIIDAKYYPTRLSNHTIQTITG